MASHKAFFELLILIGKILESSWSYFILYMQYLGQVKLVMIDSKELINSSVHV